MIFSDSSTNFSQSDIIEKLNSRHVGVVLPTRIFSSSNYGPEYSQQRTQKEHEWDVFQQKMYNESKMLSSCSERRV